MSSFIKKLLSKDQTMDNVKQLQAEFDKLRDSIKANAIMVVGTGASYKGLPIIYSTGDSISERTLAAELPALIAAAGKLSKDVFKREILELNIIINGQNLYCKLISPSLALCASFEGSSNIKKLEAWISKHFKELMNLFNI